MLELSLLFCHISDTGKTEMKVADLSRIKSEHFCTFLTNSFWHWKIRKKKKLGFTSLSSPASKIHKAEKNLHGWRSVRGKILKVDIIKVLCIAS